MKGENERKKAENRFKEGTVAGLDFVVLLVHRSREGSQSEKRLDRFMNGGDGASTQETESCEK